MLVGSERRTGQAANRGELPKERSLKQRWSRAGKGYSRVMPGGHSSASVCKTCQDRAKNSAGKRGDPARAKNAPGYENIILFNNNFTRAVNKRDSAGCLTGDFLQAGASPEP